MKRSRITSALVAGSAVALTAGLLAPAAFGAAAKFTVTAGSAKSGTAVKFAGATTGKSPQVKLVDKTTGTTLSCTSAGAGGSITVGKNEAGGHIGTISGPGTTWKGCTGPLNLVLNPKGSGTWYLNAASYKGGVTTGSISQVSATVSSTDKKSCVFAVTGNVPITYTNKTGVLAVLGNKADLTIGKVTGCFGAVNKGDKASFAASYKVTVSKADSPLSITSS